MKARTYTAMGIAVHIRFLRSQLCFGPAETRWPPFMLSHLGGLGKNLLRQIDALSALILK
jgi:hypothetical protein